MRFPSKARRSSEASLPSLFYQILRCTAGPLHHSPLIERTQNLLAGYSFMTGRSGRSNAQIIKPAKAAISAIMAKNITLSMLLQKLPR